MRIVIGFFVDDSGFRGGPTVRKTSAETNVRLFIPDKDSSPQDSQITLEGDCENVFRCDLLTYLLVAQMMVLVCMYVHPSY